MRDSCLAVTRSAVALPCLIVASIPVRYRGKRSRLGKARADSPRRRSRLGRNVLERGVHVVLSNPVRSLSIPPKLLWESCLAVPGLFNAAGDSGDHKPPPPSESHDHPRPGDARLRKS